MSITAPYVNGMRLGQGFNTYTHEIRIENGVRIKTAAPLTPEKNLIVTPAGLDSPPISRPETPQKQLNGQPNQSTPTKSSKNVAAGNPPQQAAAEAPSAAQALFQRPQSASDVPFVVDHSLPIDASQAVTFSTRAIDNVSDIMDALNISTAMSIKYGTIHGNANGSFVNETKVLDSELNYVVSVKVNNGSAVEPEYMEFQPIDALPRDQFTEVYGDSFISGFLEGGEFNAVISVKVHDKRKLRQVKQAVDVQLAVGPPPLNVGAKEAVSKSHSEALEDTEITISVNWCGGGEIKKPEEPWTLASVVAVANAFPSMVARCSARTSAILTRYESLRSFQTWRWKMAAHDAGWKDRFILNYAPCLLYTADLFDALMSYKKMWKKIGYIMQDTSKWKARDPPRVLSDDDDENTVTKLDGTTVNMKALTQSPQDARDPSHRSSCVDHAHSPRKSPSPERAITFAISDPMITASWDLDALNKSHTPVELDPVSLNEARLLCREAMTLITEEAARLVNHPELAYAEFDGVTRKTKMKRPNYAYPEVLRSRLPVFLGNDASLPDGNSGLLDDAAKLTQRFARDGTDLFCHVEGDAPVPHRTYKPFTSLALSEQHSDASSTHGSGGAGALRQLAVHGYRHHWYSHGRFGSEADGAIGAIGFRFGGDKEGADAADGCSIHVGKPAAGHWSHHEKDASSKVSEEHKSFKSLSLEKLDIAYIDISYVPGTGRIAGISLFDRFSGQTVERLAWRQWGVAGKEPEGLKTVRQEPPDDGESWAFVGLCGDFEQGQFAEVLARVSGVWRRV